MQTRQSPTFSATASSTEPVVLPSHGEALITMKTLAAAMDVSESTAWAWARTDPNFPPLVRRGERFTRLQLSAARDYIASMTGGEAKESPAKRKKSSEAAE
jgi:predicted DNA-binding transcriptional regulator AlpA